MEMGANMYVVALFDRAGGTSVIASLARGRTSKASNTRARLNYCGEMRGQCLRQLEANLS